MAQDDQYWYGNRNGSDVVMSLLPSPVPLTALEEEAGEIKERHSMITRKRKRHNRESEQDEEQEVRSLEDLHLHSNRLRTCSKYFETCLSERWAKGVREGSDADQLHLSLDVHTNVKYYKDCFSRMYSAPCQKIPSVKYCLKLLQVASQIEYRELVEACVRYLAAVTWSHDDEMRIRNFAKSLYYPTDCAADLSARLELSLSGTERYDSLLKLTQEALHGYLMVPSQRFVTSTLGVYSGRFSQNYDGEGMS